MKLSRMKPRVWLGDCQESSTSLWVHVGICESQGFPDPKLENKRNWSHWLPPEGEAESQPFWESIRCSWVTLQARARLNSPDTGLVKHTQDKFSTLEVRAELTGSLMSHRGTVCNLCSTVWFGPAAGVYRPHTALQGSTSTTACAWNHHNWSLAQGGQLRPLPEAGLQEGAQVLTWVGSLLLHLIPHKATWLLPAYTSSGPV